LQGRCSTNKARATGARATRARGRRRGEWGQPRPGSLNLKRGPLNLSVAAPCSVQHTPTALFRDVSEKIKADFRQQTKCYDLNLNLGRQPNKKITTGRPDRKHDLQAPTSYKIRSLANHFAKSTKHMIEESKSYTDHPKLQVVYDFTRSRIQGGV
jgi:hypothetical protein